ncbi:hypothetical protein HHK36_005088 [Tetracentron sinense]|uniref:Uncharacterized protein n=1 Tax=Tetracentron sinense TaxID=13715 RepID=A0A834ZMI5_TETSI|nr:hypothetical protein HHK36_005088 [Tetracentron sinense]
MFIMDLQCKGITWVGNIYQKFEAMCLELDDIMCQDTVQYVENQVQTVGASANKICSDVMQDLLPPSSVDPVKGAAPDFSLEQNTEIGTDKKSKVGIDEDPINIDIDQSTELDVIALAENKQGHASSFSGLTPSSVDPVNGACSKISLGQNDDVEMYKKSNVDIEENPVKEKPHSSEMSEVIAPVDKDSRRAGFSDSSALPYSDSILPVISCNKVMEMGLTPSIGVLSAESDGADTSTINETVFMMGSEIEHKQYCHSGQLEAFMLYPEIAVTGRSEEPDTEVSNGNGVTEPGMETIEPFHKVKLEGSCVMVDSNELCFVSHGEGKHRSYKKKIRDAFASKMKLAKKQEYEQLEIWYRDVNAGSNQQRVENSKLSILTRDFDSKQIPTHDFCESDWELL